VARLCAVYPDRRRFRDLDRPRRKLSRVCCHRDVARVEPLLVTGSVHQMGTRVSKGRLSGGVVLRLEFERDSVSDGSGDLIWGVHQTSATTDDDDMVGACARPCGCVGLCDDGGRGSKDGGGDGE